ncbi:matrix metalloproteinase-9 isoform X1 [Arachis ipaensis]|uniref:Uncharacterized protein n=1 Tax=Arachis hypogaea TaxID=3818 RepID=A0A445DLC1_ARAHY|nr:matrix metalloproteinase-9 isoform X1 [Arachis ipaensis]XP_020975694.1 matrix metalloproteinase-9 isoform X1 [Arachis ipaensis]XP_020975695.1 matrix metalloproteinase-9 isoform X1 [Arachis ipaensis]XP_025640198.1 matrix metalloproteinase-9 isoform X1 [Arachis hypogaea]XP_029147685.1 matrix metalloproteinase-9 isoform X1 [Arachis hypogaea]XP_029147686.1 matrix metalloproteinase-9 isoform X1 [Arachis hypogaea]QHO05103.1 uncharacterized protein DS421_13g445790 [Arachis hypogaea]RYR63979.1 hy
MSHKKSSLALVFALVLALPIHSVFGDEVNENPWKNLFDEEISVGSLEEVPKLHFVDHHSEFQDWVQELSNLDNKNVNNVVSKETPASAPVQAPKVSPPKRAPTASPKAAPKTAPKAAPVASPKSAPKAAPVASPRSAPVASPITSRRILVE